MRLHSPAFDENQQIPVLFIREGGNISPPLHWNDIPADTESFALIMEDPDAPSGVFTHWLLYNLPGSMRGLDREVPKGDHYGAHAFQGVNDFGSHGYDGPQPPQGEHRYIFKLYALDSRVPLESGADKATLLQAMEGHILAEADLTGLYNKKSKDDIEREMEKAEKEEDAYDRAAHYGEGYQDRSPKPRRGDASEGL